MAITLTITTNVAIKLLRDDIVENLGWKGVDAIIDYYEDQGEELEFDQAVFSEWTRYDSAEEACRDKHIEVDRNDFEGEPLDDEDYEAACCKELQRKTVVLEMLDGSVIVNDEF